jgi:hypothetical protein
VPLVVYGFQHYVFLPIAECSINASLRCIKDVMQLTNKELPGKKITNQAEAGIADNGIVLTTRWRSEFM